jgi:hypothetical protein
MGVALSIAAAAAAAPAQAAPLLSMPYSIGAFSQALQFMGDGSVRVACDGSVLVACDGSVRVIENASFRTLGDGSVREVTPMVLLGDGSVRVGSAADLSGQDGMALTSLTFSPNPLLTGSVFVLDAGSPTTFLFTFAGPISLGGTAFTYELAGSATLTDPTGGSVSLTAQPLLGLSTPGIIAGGVDGSPGVATIGSNLTGNGTTVLTPASGNGTCVACALQILAFGLQGSGDGDKYSVTGTFDITDPTVVVPAPAPLGLLASGLVLLGLVRRRG